VFCEFHDTRKNFIWESVLSQIRVHDTLVDFENSFDVVLHHLEMVEVSQQSFVQILSVGCFCVDTNDVEVYDFVHCKTFLLIQ